MNLKRFFAKDMRSALQEIKEELGSEAIIMSSKNVSGGVEIVAAVDDSARKENEKNVPTRTLPSRRIHFRRRCSTKRLTASSAFLSWR